MNAKILKTVILQYDNFINFIAVLCDNSDKKISTFLHFNPLSLYCNKPT